MKSIVEIVCSVLFASSVPAKVPVWRIFDPSEATVSTEVRESETGSARINVDGAIDAVERRCARHWWVSWDFMAPTLPRRGHPGCGRNFRGVGSDGEIF